MLTNALDCISMLVENWMSSEKPPDDDDLEIGVAFSAVEVGGVNDVLFPYGDESVPRGRVTDHSHANGLSGFGVRKCCELKQ